MDSPTSGCVLLTLCIAAAAGTVRGKIVNRSSATGFLQKSDRQLSNEVMIVSESEKHPNTPNIISRREWGAQAPTQPLTPLAENPPPYVVIHHSATPGCTTQAVCQAKVRSIQNYHMNERHWNDIGYNFLIGEDGNVYEGRGWGMVGAHSVRYNSRSMGVCVLGDFTNRTPNPAAIKAVADLISFGVASGNIKSDYVLFGHRQTANTDCPGNKLYELLTSWPHYSPTEP